MVIQLCGDIGDTITTVISATARTQDTGYIRSTDRPAEPIYVQCAGVDFVGGPEAAWAGLEVCMISVTTLEVGLTVLVV